MFGMYYTYKYLTEMPTKTISEIKYATIFFLEALTMRTHSWICNISVLSVKKKFDGLTVKVQSTFLQIFVQIKTASLS